GVGRSVMLAGTAGDENQREQHQSGAQSRHTVISSWVETVRNDLGKTLWVAVHDPLKPPHPSSQCFLARRAAGGPGPHRGADKPPDAGVAEGPRPRADGRVPVKRAADRAGDADVCERQPRVALSARPRPARPAERALVSLRPQMS